jgi:hypothetical protein
MTYTVCKETHEDAKFCLLNRKLARAAFLRTCSAISDLVDARGSRENMQGLVNQLNQEFEDALTCHNHFTICSNITNEKTIAQSNRWVQDLKNERTRYIGLVDTYFALLWQDSPTLKPSADVVKELQATKELIEERERELKRQLQILDVRKALLDQRLNDLNAAQVPVFFSEPSEPLTSGPSLKASVATFLREASSLMDQSPRQDVRLSQPTSAHPSTSRVTDTTEPPPLAPISRDTRGDSWISALPPMKVPTFTGDPGEWPKFAASFATIHHSSDDDNYRMAMLRESLSPKVRQVIEPYLSNGNLYPLALQELKRMYGHHDELIKPKVETIEREDEASSSNHLTGALKGKSLKIPLRRLHTLSSPYGIRVSSAVLGHRCVACNGPHDSSTCPSYLQLSLDDRAAKVRESNACYRCLGKSHRSSDCTRNDRCGVDGCQKAHHFTLHGCGRIYPNKFGSIVTSSWRAEQS